MFEDWDTLQSRTQDWIFLDSPSKITTICTAYLVFVLYIGPKFMANRNAYSLKYVLMGYNVFQIAMSYYMIKEFLTNGVSFRELYLCRLSNYSDESQNMYRAKLIHYSFLLKIVELIETVFFVLRKKQSQVSTLHVYHHISTMYIGYFYAKYIGCSIACVCVILNFIVHFFMYLYYLLSSFGDKNWQQKLLFYKMAITKIQIIQFLIFLTHAIIIVTKPCAVDRILVAGMAFALPDLFILLYMFVKFYIKSYNTKSKLVSSVVNSETKKVM